MLEHGLQIRSEMVILKLLELLKAILNRIQRVGEMLFEMKEGKQLEGIVNVDVSYFFSHFASILPSSESFFSLFKHLLSCLTKKEPISGKVRRKKEEEVDSNLVVSTTKVMEVEEEEEKPKTELIVQTLMDYLVLHYSLFPAGIAQIRLDVSALFVPTANVPLLFSLEERTQVSILHFFHTIVSRNTNLVSALTVKNQNKPLLTLLNHFNETPFLAVQEALESLLLSLLTVCYFFMNIPNSKLFLHFLLRCPLPSFSTFLHETVQDLKSQRIRFISRDHGFQLNPPLSFSAALYASLKPSAVNTEVFFFTFTQMLLMTNPCALFSVQGLIAKYVDEAGKEESSLFAGQMNEDMLQALRNLQRYWSHEPKCEDPRGTMELNLTGREITIHSLFHCALWHDLMQGQVEEVVKNPIMLLVLLLNCSRMENKSVTETLLFLVNSESARNGDDFVKLASVCLLLRFTDNMAGIQELCSSMKLHPNLSVLMLLLVLGVTENQWNWVSLWRTFVETCPDCDIISLTEFTLSPEVVSFWTASPSQTYNSLLLQRFISILGGNTDQLRRQLITLLLSNTDSSLVSLSLLHPFFFAEEKLVFFQRLVEHCEDSSLVSTLSSLSIQWKVPFELSLLQQLVTRCASSSLCVVLLWSMLDSIPSLPPSVSSSIPGSLIDVCLSQLQNDPYFRLAKLLLGQSSSHRVHFLHLLSSSFDDYAHQHFPRLCSLLSICLHSPDSRGSTLSLLPSTSFVSCFLQSLTAASSSCTSNSVDGGSCTSTSGGSGNNITDTSEYDVNEAMTALAHEPSLFTQASSLLVAEMATVCKGAFATSLSVGFLQVLMSLCEQMGSERERLESILLLKGIQAIAKRWQKEVEVEGEFVREFVRQLEGHRDALNRIARKQPDLAGRFIKLILKKGLQDTTSLNLLLLLLQAVNDERVEMEGLSSDRVLELIVNHSEYSAVLDRIRTDCVCPDDDALRTRWYHFTLEQYSYSVVFLRVIQLLLHQSPRSCTPQLFTQLLSLYACSLSPSDRVLRDIFKELYVLEQFSLEDYGYLFGRFAPSSAGNVVETPSTWVIDVISSLRFRKSCEAFPSEMEEKEEMEIEEREVSEEDDSEDEFNPLVGQVESRRNSISLPASESSFNDTEDCIDVLLRTSFSSLPVTRDSILLVDPTIFLPLLHYYLHLDSTAPFLYISHGILGYLITSLSSSNSTIRQCGSCLLQRLFEIISDSSFNEKKQIELLLRKFQNSIENPATRIPAIITSFLTESVGILLRPGNTMYSAINRFFLNGATFPLSDIPLFNQLFLSSGEDYRTSRAWCMRFILRGTQSETDVKLLNRRHVISQIQSFATSSICDAYSEKLGLAEIIRLVSIPAVIPLLCRNMNILPWIVSVMLRTRQNIIRFACIEMIEQITNAGYVSFTEGLLVVRKMLLMCEKVDRVTANKVILPCLRVFVKVCSDVEGSAQEKAMMVAELSQLMARVAEMKACDEKEGVVENCQLSNDDFILLCEPVLRSVAQCREEAETLLKEASLSVLRENHQLEKELDALFLFSLCCNKHTTGG